MNKIDKSQPLTMGVKKLPVYKNTNITTGHIKEYIKCPRFWRLGHYPA
jgi:hypothetical protein